MSDLSDFRRSLDAYMVSYQSPLEEEQREQFQGLAYFPENDALRFEVEVVRFADDEPTFEMETSTGEVRPFRRWGRFSFEVDGQLAELTIYFDGHGLFLPFKDSTSGQESYAAGRYLDNQRPGLTWLTANRLQVDFNYCYNPYCAYSPYFSCPLPPRENWVAVPIAAGEKAFVL